MKSTPLAVLLLLSCLGSGVAHADLIDRGSGLIYDTNSHITWLNQRHGPGTWYDAMDWASGLTINGVTGWRLPTVDTAWYFGSNGELPQLFAQLGGVFNNDNHSCSPGPMTTLLIGDIYDYWAIQLNPGCDCAYGFCFTVGFSFWQLWRGSPEYYSLAVHDGDVGAPTPVRGATWGRLKAMYR
jgi:hypothetical protein